jgi:hypothetical protein
MGWISPSPTKTFINTNPGTHVPTSTRTLAILYTSYRLMTYETGNHPAPLKAIQASLGTIESYGLDKQISLEAIAAVDLNAALWALRAVYPEQRSLTSKLSRRFAGAAFRVTSVAWARPFNGYRDIEPLRKLVAVADDYLLGLCNRGFMEGKAKESFRLAASYDIPALRWLAYLAWIALGPKPERLGPSILDAALESNPHNPKEESLEHRKCKNAMTAALRGKLLEVLEPRDEAIGPVALGFDGSFTTKPKHSPDIGKVRAYRHKTTIRNMLEARGV